MRAADLRGVRNPVVVVPEKIARVLKVCSRSTLELAIVTKRRKRRKIRIE
jgi:hypothetical protein